MYRLPAGCEEPALQVFLDYWESKRRDGKLPARRDIDPLELPKVLLPQILLFEVIRTPERLRFRFRLAGTAFSRLVGRDVTGVIFDELGPPERTAPVSEALTAVVESGRPAYLAGRLTLRSDSFEHVRRLGLPLASDGKTVDMILSMWLAQSRPIGDYSTPSRAEAMVGKVQLLEGD